MAAKYVTSIFSELSFVIRGQLNVSPSQGAACSHCVEDSSMVAAGCFQLFGQIVVFLV